jgi:hypothetical protein
MTENVIRFWNHQLLIARSPRAEDFNALRRDPVRQGSAGRQLGAPPQSHKEDSVMQMTAHVSWHETFRAGTMRQPAEDGHASRS